MGSNRSNFEISQVSLNHTAVTRGDGIGYCTLHSSSWLDRAMSAGKLTHRNMLAAYQAEGIGNGGSVEECVEDGKCSTF